MMNSFKPVSPHINFCFGFLLWITRGLIGRNVKFHFLSRKTNCIKLLKWRARFWLIDQWFSGFCLRFFRRFLLSTRSRKSLSFYFLSTKASLFFPVIFDQRNIVFNAFDDLVYSTNLLHTQMYPIIKTICFRLHVVVTEMSGMNSVTYDLFREGNELVTEGKLKMTTIVAMAMRWKPCTCCQQMPRFQVNIVNSRENTS